MGEDPVLTSCEPFVQVIPPRGALTVSKTDTEG